MTPSSKEPREATVKEHTAVGPNLDRLRIEHQEHDHKGFSEEKCIRCGWVMGQRPLNCNNDDTPHVFPSQLWMW